MSQVKPGDRAIVIARPDSLILGWFVHVREYWDRGPIEGEPWTGEELNMPLTYVVLDLPHPLTLAREDGSLVTVRAVPFPAPWLQPIRGVPVTEEQHEEICA